MHEYKLNYLIVHFRSCTHNLKLAAILFLFSLFLYCVVLSYVFVNSGPLHIYFMICNKSSSIFFKAVDCCKVISSVLL